MSPAQDPPFAAEPSVGPKMQRNPIAAPARTRRARLTGRPGIRRDFEMAKMPLLFPGTILPGGIQGSTPSYRI